MLYLLAIVFSLIVSVQGFASEITAGNISHLKNGRTPNAGAAIFPTIPVLPLFAVGAAWMLQSLIPHYAIWILIGLFLIFSAFWAFSFMKLKAEFDRIKKL